MIKQKTINIRGNEYLLTQLKTTTGIGALRMLTSMAGPVLAALQSGTEDSVSQAILAVSAQMETPLVEGLMHVLLPTCTLANGSAINVDIHFAGDYMHLMEVMQAIVEFNFGDVLEAFGGLVMIPAELHTKPVEELAQAV